MLKCFLPLSQKQIMNSFQCACKLVPGLNDNLSVGVKLPYLGICSVYSFSQQHSGNFRNGKILLWSNPVVEIVGHMKPTVTNWWFLYLGAERDCSSPHGHFPVVYVNGECCDACFSYHGERENIDRVVHYIVCTFWEAFTSKSVEKAQYGFGSLWVDFCW